MRPDQADDSFDIEYIACNSDSLCAEGVPALQSFRMAMKSERQMNKKKEIEDIKLCNANDYFHQTMMLVCYL